MNTMMSEVLGLIVRNPAGYSSSKAFFGNPGEKHLNIVPHNFHIMLARNIVFTYLILLKLKAEMHEYYPERKW
jgi:hypothetical protein